MPLSSNPPSSFAERNANSGNSTETARHRNSPSPDDNLSSPIHLSQLSSRQPSRNPSPLPPGSSHGHPNPPNARNGGLNRQDAALADNKKHDKYSDDDEEDSDGVEDFPEWDDGGEMPSDLRPPFHRPTDGRSQTPLLSGNKKQENGGIESPRRPHQMRRRSTFRERHPDIEAKSAMKTRYTYAAFFLLVSLIAFVIQTETAVYIQHELKWNKAYAMLYFTHGSWTLLWFLQLAILRVQKWNMPWEPFWRRHKQLLHQTAMMVEHHDLMAPSKYPRSPIPYMLKTTALVTCALTVAGGSWYVAVDLTTASDLTAIYNCSAFFAYVFSVPILKERLRWSKVLAVGVAIIGVIVVAYGDSAPAKHGSHSGGGAGGPGSTPDEDDEDSGARNRALGNIVIGVGSVLYGFYEVLYKKFACPPEECSPGRAMIFANLFASLIGTFTLTVLWIPLPILHYTGIEVFEWPTGETAWMLAISTFCNAIFSGSFLVLISLTSPVLSSVAALLTIFLVALVDQLLPPPLRNDLSFAAIIGGCLIIGAFLVLSWATYREMEEERQKKMDTVVDSDEEEPAARVSDSE